MQALRLGSMDNVSALVVDLRPLYSLYSAGDSAGDMRAVSAPAPALTSPLRAPGKF